MAALSWVVFLVITSASASAEDPSVFYQLGDVRNCPVKSPHDDSKPLYLMEVLPGVGFDNLRNLDMGQVHTYNFSTCQVSKDGKFLLPDSVFLAPVQESKVNVYAEYLDHWDNYTSTTCNSINLESSFFSHISAKFSVDFMSTKTHMYNDNAKSTRVQIRHKLYSVKLQPDAQLHPTFKSRVYDIAGNIQNNNTDYAHYLAELMVREYGTHYVTSMDAGAILSQVDFVQVNSKTDKDDHIRQIKASASANFFKKISLGATFQHKSSADNQTTFVNTRTHSQVITAGGPPFSPNMTLEEWERGVPGALVAIDRSGDPLHFAITPTSLPMLPESTIMDVANYVKAAINRYYKVNTRGGCTDPNSKNFDFHANLDDNTCISPTTNHSFGGIYQTCTTVEGYETEDLCVSGPEPALQVNPLTGKTSCPPHYTPILLHSGTVSHVMRKKICNNVCHHCHLWSHCCHCDNVLTPFLSVARYNAYWCAALNPADLNQEESYLFGGYYNSRVANPVTGAMSCPRYFYPLHMGEDTKVCVSSDYERAFAFAVDFAGFESCSVGNPLSHSNPTEENQAHWPHLCPHGYSQHLAMIEDGCEVNFCVRAGAFASGSLYALKLPPFRKHPKFKSNVSDTLVVFGMYGQTWVKNEDGSWEQMNSEPEDGQSLLTSLNEATKSHDLSSGGIAAVSIVATIVLGLLIIFLGFMGRRVYRKRKVRRTSPGYERVGSSASLVQDVETEDSAQTV